MWQLQVSTPKCCMLQLNPRYAYRSISQFTTNGAPLPAHDNVRVLRDLGVIVTVCSLFVFLCHCLYFYVIAG